MTIVARLGAPATTTQHAICASLSSEPLDLYCSGGTIDASAWSSRYDDGAREIYTCTVSIAGLAPFTRYQYRIKQGAQPPVSGEFRTLPGDQRTDFALILATCDSWNAPSAFDTPRAVRAVCRQSPEPVLLRLHIDDLDYPDNRQINDAETSLATTGRPESTGLGRDFAVNWYANLGGLSSVQKWRGETRAWMNHNLPLVASPGDHAFEENHCRGQVGANDYNGCNRGPDADVPNLEENALAEWMAFIGNAQSALYLRAGRLHMGLEIGPVRFGVFDHQLYCEPYEAGVSGSDLVCYGSEQIADLKAWLDTSAVPFKVACFESGLASGQGQPWFDWHPDEAAAWAADWLAEPNLNGEAGNLAIWQGDNHRAFSFEAASWWVFCAGVFQDSSSVIYNPWTLGGLGAPWDGTYRWRWQNNVTQPNGQIEIGGFWYVRVLASETPRRITMQFIHGAQGDRLERLGIAAATISPVFTLTEGAASNQWSQESLTAARRFV